MSSNSGTVLSVEGLTKRYRETVAVDGLSLTARAGEISALLGPNGAGKSTTIECCVGLKTPDAGRVSVLGMNPRVSATAVRARTGVMLQDGGLPMGAKPREILDHLSRFYARPRDVAELTGKLGIDGFGNRTVRRLSGGQKQRLALAAALLGNPELLFLDEPTAGLDPQARGVVWELVEELRSDGVAIVLTTHMMEDAERLADQVYIVDRGTVVASGSPAELTGTGAAATRAVGAASCGSGASGTGSSGSGSSGSGASGSGTPEFVRFEAPARLDLTALARALGNDADGGVAAVEETSPGSYQVSGGITPQVLATITAWCAEQAVMPKNLTLGRRSLEDVFLDLTGRALR